MERGSEASVQQKGVGGLGGWCHAPDLPSATCTPGFCADLRGSIQAFARCARESGSVEDGVSAIRRLPDSRGQVREGWDMR